MSETITYTVPGIHCNHCALSIKEEVSEVEGVDGVEVDIDAKVDASLIGGAKAQIGSVVYDGTIKNQLDKMRNQLMN